MKNVGDVGGSTTCSRLTMEAVNRPSTLSCFSSLTKRGSGFVCVSDCICVIRKCSAFVVAAIVNNDVREWLWTVWYSKLEFLCTTRMAAVNDGGQARKPPAILVKTRLHPS